MTITSRHLEYSCDYCHKHIDGDIAYKVMGYAQYHFGSKDCAEKFALNKAQIWSEKLNRDFKALNLTG